MVSVDKEKCIACGHCAQVCPNVFEMGEDGHAQVKKGQEGSSEPCVDKAVAECPASCISK